ncbi:hypothetical protein [Amnibacterium setariae]|uniref:hypothetical protein n=1 Tax=Amnibacterium setariae TaxID=2306585 RepID=UPI001314E5C5|nr:hypothetical protein [Amnibacterium setariae]
MSTFIDPETGGRVTVADSKDARYARWRRVPGSEGVADVGLVDGQPALDRLEAEERARAAGSAG